jgi:hypothetical protein
MGGDFAPKATIAGALLALQELDGAHTVQLVGQTSIIEAELKRLISGELSHAASGRKHLNIVEAPEVIEMSEKPTAGLRKKPKSSMVVGLKLQVDGKSDAFVSAGNTGAQMASSAMLLKLHPVLRARRLRRYSQQRAIRSLFLIRARTSTAPPGSCSSSRGSARFTRNAFSVGRILRSAFSQLGRSRRRETQS